MNPPFGSPGTHTSASRGTSLLRQVFEGSAWNGLAISVSRLAPSVLTILLACWLDPKELGIFAFVMAYYGVLSLFADWSIAYSLQKLIPENLGSTAEITWTALCIRLSFSALIAVLCWVLDVATKVFRGYGSHLGLLLVSSSFGIIVCVYNARCKFAVGSFLNIVFQIGWISVALVLVNFGMHITGPLFALAVSYFVFGFPAFLLDFKQPTARFSPRFASEMLHFGTWATLASTLAGIASQGGLLILAYLSGDASAGIYRVATTLGMIPAVLGMVVVTPLMPIVKRGLLEGTDVTASLILPILRYLLMVALPIAATAAAFSRSIIAALVRDSYASAALPMCICLVANLLQMLLTTFSGILLVGEGLRDLSKIQGVIALIAVVGSASLAPKIGANGPALASLVAWLVGDVLLYQWFARRTVILFEWVSYARYAFSAGVSAVVAVLATRSIVSPGHRCSAGACLSLALYLMLLWFQQDPGFLQFLRALKRGLPEKAALGALKISRVD
ncbi:MAG TPA: oligosaccharide flippase family protein [Terriglobales bacterium]|jgi:O-antigen/teichoic acid export membrane protein|nr:oligosaccharide flippase family protein [Terriglobales bacterium]